MIKSPLLQSKIKNKERFTSWEKFDPWKYAQRNYGEKMLPEDKMIIQEVTKYFEKIEIKRKQLDSVADIGAGPNLYPAMLLAPYVKDKGKINLIEFASSNIEYLKKILYSNRNGEIKRHQKNWENYGKQIEKLSGKKYKNCYEHVKNLIKN